MMKRVNHIWEQATELVQPLSCAKHVAHSRQQCHNNSVTTQNKWFLQEKLLKVLKCYNFCMNAMTTQLLSSGEFCKLRYDTASVKSASANVSFYTSNSKMPNFELWHSCRKWAVSKLLATARGWHRSLRAVVMMWAEFHAVYWEVHLHDTRLMTHEIKGWE